MANEGRAKLAKVPLDVTITISFNAGYWQASWYPDGVKGKKVGSSLGAELPYEVDQAYRELQAAKMRLQLALRKCGPKDNDWYAKGG